MLTPAVQEALNRQINMEFESSYAYLAMSSYCAIKNFPGAARWMLMQSEEENAHAMRLRQFLLDRDCPVVLHPIKAPNAEFNSIPSVFERALEQEKAVSRSIDDLYELALHEKAFAALVELQWFITEQVEEEKTVREIVAKFNMVKDDPSAIIDLDRELGEQRKKRANNAASYHHLDTQRSFRRGWRSDRLFEWPAAPLDCCKIAKIVVGPDAASSLSYPESMNFFAHGYRYTDQPTSWRGPVS